MERIAAEDRVEIVGLGQLAERIAQPPGLALEHIVSPGGVFIVQLALEEGADLGLCVAGLGQLEPVLRGAA